MPQIVIKIDVRGVSDVGYAPVIGNSSTGGWFGILGGTHEKDCVLFMSRLKIVSGLPYTIVIESWNTHASSSSQEALLWKAAARGLKEKRERSQRVPLALPLSYSLFSSPLPMVITLYYHLSLHSPNFSSLPWSGQWPRGN